jgi:hypothetical protein
MTTEQLVRSARNPQEAMLHIAAALDRIEAKLDQQPAAEPDPWGNWGHEYNIAERGPETVIPPRGDGAAETIIRARQNKQAIEGVQAMLDVEADAEERRALEAKLRLLKDEGASIIRREAGVRVQSLVDDSTVTVDIPPASPERQEDRRRFARNGHLHSFLSQPALNEAEFEDAYAKGGPMWLYLGDRDAIMAMPPEYRVLMVADIEEDSPAQAQEVARDLLMDRGAEGTTAVDRIYGE